VSFRTTTTTSTSSPGQLASMGALVAITERFDTDVNHELRCASGLTTTEFLTLNALRSADGHTLSMTELSDVAGLSRSNASHVIERLVAAGLVIRTRDTFDHRRRHAVLTELGCAKAVSSACSFEKVVRQTLATRLSVGETIADRLARAFADVSGVAGELDGQPD
jgi:DNA-binding MarR family transcriptional regulator